MRRRRLIVADVLGGTRAKPKEMADIRSRAGPVRLVVLFFLNFADLQVNVHDVLLLVWQQRHRQRW